MADARLKAPYHAAYAELAGYEPIEPESRILLRRNVEGEERSRSGYRTCELAYGDLL